MQSSVRDTFRKIWSRDFQIFALSLISDHFNKSIPASSVGEFSNFCQHQKNGLKGSFSKKSWTHQTITALLSRRNVSDSKFLLLFCAFWKPKENKKSIYFKKGIDDDFIFVVLLCCCLFKMIGKRSRKKQAKLESDACDGCSRNFEISVQLRGRRFEKPKLNAEIILGGLELQQSNFSRSAIKV